jgi:hypothetical protein
MIGSNSPQHSRAAILLRRLSTGDDHARPRAAQDSHLVLQSSSLDAGSAYRDRPQTHHLTDRFPKRRSTHVGYRPLWPKSP